MLTALLVLSSLLPGQVEQAARRDIGPQVRKLVRQLDSNELARRDAAERELISMGPDALPHLPRITSRTSAEVKQRLKRIRDTLQKAAAEAATRASLVTLDADAKPLSEVLGAIKRQTGNQLIDFRPRFGQQARDMEIKAEFENTPFWEAVDQVLDRAGLTLYHYTGQQHVTAIVGREPGALPRFGRAAYCGIFRFEATEITAVRNLRQEAGDMLRLSLEITWEPRLLPIALAQPLGDVAAVDETGKPVGVPGHDGSLEVPVQNGVSAAEMDIPLVLPDRAVKRIASFKGKLTALVPGRIETYEFPKLVDTKDVEQRKGGVTVILQTVRKNVDVHEVRILVRFDKAANALESHRGWIYNNEAYLIDADGKVLEHGGFETTRQETNEVGVAYKFPLKADLSGYTFVYKTPAAIVKMPVEYELKNIELP